MPGRPQGFDSTRVRVTSVSDDGFCQVVDTLGKERVVRHSLRPKGTARPAVGETWVISRLGGGDTWVLDLMVGVPEPPVVEGSRTGVDALTLSLLDALAQIGLVQDDTTA